MPNSEAGLTVAVTGPTGTFGFALVPHLVADPRIGDLVGIARRPFDPAAHGWTTMSYRQGDVRDPDALAAAFAGADVVVHLAFLITGGASSATARAVNVDGTLHAFRAAAAAGARRFVYASSVAAYGFHPDNPVGLVEDWPTRPAERLFYAQEKAELEVLLATEAATTDMDLYVLRPPVVVGPHGLGAKDLIPPALLPAVRLATQALGRSPVPVPVMLPALPLQLVHEDDVADAFVRCITGAGPPGAYNIAGDGIVTTHDVARALGLLPLPLPVGLTQRGARALAAVPLPRAVPPVTGWVEALSHPVIVDTTRATDELGWRPAYSAAEALRAVAPTARG
ncbi:MAG TPA: NAD-dependent epimerase/dehydratase family protein [Acidimicrobiales bacterium]|nr:NAD-dependent epimerase/dehydratase family protein [Acidimicrobiales bacterium]